MVWRLRPNEDVDMYKPYECPEYRSPELFTIKIWYDGEMLDDPRRYNGGKIAYVDWCDSDEISLLDINDMLVECGARGGFYNLWYKLVGTTMDRGLFELNSDDELMVMCTLISKSRYVELYVTGTLPIDVVNDMHPEEIRMEDPFPDSTQQEQDLAEEVRHMEGVYEDFSDYDESEEEWLDGEDDDDESFHSDKSNKDYEDDDLLFDLHVDRNLNDNYEEDEEGEKDVNDKEESDDSTIYAGSDDERMVADSTDEDEKTYPVFNEDVDMKKPIFELGMLFRSSGVFRKAVKTHAILERRPVENVRNYGKKVKYICQPPCSWKVYASPMHKTSTYQIKKAADEGTEPIIKKSTVVCKTCKKEGHNSRTCALKKQQQSTNMEQEQDQQTLFNLMQQGQGEMHCTQQSSTSNQPFQAKKITPRKKK